MKLELLKFINNNEDWEEKLSQKPYCLKINRDSKYIIFKYDQINSDFSLDIVKEARGLILEDNTFRVVCFPFIKFFNIDETYADKIDWNSAQVQEKVDGSIIKVWSDMNDNIREWHISTNSCIDAFKCEIQGDLCPYGNFGSLFMSVFDTSIFSRLNVNYTYIFELVSPYTKIVVPYPYTDIYHLGTRDNVSGKELNIDIGIKKPKLYNLGTEQEIRKAANDLPFNEEGYVVVDKEYRRVKVKSPAYVNAHRLVNNRVVNTEKVLELILQNEQDEFLSYFPEYKDTFVKVQRLLNKYKKYLFTLQERVLKLKEKSEDKKDFAIKLQKRVRHDTSMGFMLYDNKINNWEEYFQKLSISKIVERIRDYETN